MNKKWRTPFTQLISIATCTKLADLLISASTTLPWLLTSLGAPGWIISLLVPIRESGSLIPQWSIKQKTQDIENRVVLWRFGILAQTSAIFCILLAALFTRSLMAGLLILFSLIAMSLGRSLTSLSMKDIQGSNIDKGKRGKLVGVASSISGLLSMLTAGLMIIAPQDKSSTLIQILLGLSVLLMILSLTLSKHLTANIKASQHQLNKTASIWKTVRSHRALQNLIISRCLLLHGALIAPFFVSFSATNSESFQLPYFIIASALATFLSSYLWGTLADKSAVRSLTWASLICVVTSVSFYFILPWQVWYLDIGLFFILSLGYAGVRTGRKTYLLDIAQGEQRTLYVAAANTTVGYILLALGGFYAVLSVWVGEHLILIMSTALALGLIHTFTLKAEK
ncbi:MFS transporter [Paraglaciecola aquimarina]|uniref:MFS transporter n=1 Tax=Paraglaciecola algarum TaxID=3050085 RepID=A0ABS9DB22_9ALTE|nr:MFS transporter [Paraglaciecola sp. G1-23]MCF2950161.1 MFS transporter [Paraglaciecola sp. G1-23]